tara:strand:- start:1856 stop:2038 length:183 start_codon:yes stop_codon:yes gene_type:complete
MTFITFMLRLVLCGVMNAVTMGNLPAAVIDAMLLTPGLVTFTSILFSAGYFWLVGLFIHD